MNTNDASRPIKVQIIDREQISLWGINQLIEQDTRFEVCASATKSQDGLKLALKTKPDVIILDPELGGENAIELITTLIQKTKSKIVIYTATKNSTLLDQAVVKGARGIVSKHDPIDTILKAAEKIYLGELWLNRNATSRILLQIAEANLPQELSAEQRKIETLTDKEGKVTFAIQQYSEKTLKEISEILHISEYTLRNHLGSIYDKLEVRNRMGLYVFCGKHQKTLDPSLHPKRRITDLA